MLEGDEAFVSDSEEPDPALNVWTNRIIGPAIEVHRILGPGFNESIYQKAMAIELRLRDIPFVEQALIEVYFKGHLVGEGRVDFLVADCILVDLKSIEALGPIQTAQMISYLDAGVYPLGLLLNFNVRVLKDGIKRIAGGGRIPHGRKS